MNSGKGVECEIRGEYLGFGRVYWKKRSLISLNTIGRGGKRVFDKLVRT